MDCPSGWFLRRKRRRDKPGVPDGSLGRSVSRRLRPRPGDDNGGQSWYTASDLEPHGREKSMENHFEPHLTADQLRAISSIGLAHMGDAVFEILVREWLCVHGKATGKGLHQATIRLVCAESQASRAQKILPLLTEEEAAVFRRGRNAQVHTIPGHATRAQYGEATALEALLGWLYLGGRRDRVNELFCVMMEEAD